MTDRLRHAGRLQASVNMAERSFSDIKNYLMEIVSAPADSTTALAANEAHLS